MIFDTNIDLQGATTQYILNVNSMARWGQDIFCASSEGLFKLSGNQDNGSDLNAYFELGMLDFDILTEKRLRYVYVYYEAEKDILMTLTTELGLTGNFTLPASSYQNRYRIPIPRSLIGRYWTFKFSGSNFAIDQIDVLPIVRGYYF